MEQTASQKKALKMVSCPACGAKQFIPGDLAPLGTVTCTKCQASVMMPMMLRQYELRSEIASGGMGTVYRAWDTALGREVAVKLMKREFAEDPAAVNNFAVEARACAQINHTNIIHIYTFDYHEGLRFLAMEIAEASRRELDRWYPGIDQTTTLRADAGVICAHGTTNIDDPSSGLHGRARVGVRSDDGYHSVDPGKLTTAPLFALAVAEAVRAH